jgi:hypothetical protein
MRTENPAAQCALGPLISDQQIFDRHLKSSRVAIPGTWVVVLVAAGSARATGPENGVRCKLMVEPKFSNEMRICAGFGANALDGAHRLMGVNFIMNI